MSENTLKHWGILGQKWGRRNGPPYPLGKGQMSDRQWKKLSPEEKAKRADIEKQDLIKRGSATDIANKLRGELTPEEYASVLYRLNNEVRLVELVDKEESIAWKKADKYITNAQTVHRGFNTAADLYNDVARAAYAGGMNMPLIPSVERIAKITDDATKYKREQQAKIEAENRKLKRDIQEERRQREEWGIKTWSEYKGKGGKGGSGLTADEVTQIVNDLLDERD